MSHEEGGNPAEKPRAEGGRRDFFTEALAILVTLAVGLVPAVVGVITFLDPLWRRSANGTWVKLATLDGLPADGIPRRFPVMMDRVDAWTRTAHLPVGAVYLRRTGESTVTALNVVCPHAGCFVDYQPAQRDYLCPCHNSLFSLDGTLASQKSPSPRPMDSLEVEIRGAKEIWVRFQNFQTGIREKTPVA